MLCSSRSHAPRGNALLSVYQQGLPRRAWEPDGKRLLFLLVPTLRVGMQRYRQGLPRRAWEPDGKRLLFLLVLLVPMLRVGMPRFVWKCNGNGKGYHAERGSQMARDFLRGGIFKLRRFSFPYGIAPASAQTSAEMRG